MKRIITIFIFLFFIGEIGYSQKTQTPEPSTDTTQKATEKTPLLTLQDYYEFDQKILSELPSKYTDAIRQWLIERIKLRIAEFEKQKLPNK